MAYHTTLVAQIPLHYQDAKRLVQQETELLSCLPNVVDYEVPSGCRLCVVGDLHGQFADLMHIFRANGFPDPNTPYLFNGDFVDRGTKSVEVMLALFALHQLHPGAVMLNRGNHEERSVYLVHGFELECKCKYDHAMVELFGKAFDRLALATIVNKKVLVLHGGVDDELTMEQLRGVARHEYVMCTAAMAGAGFVHPTMRAKMAEMKQRAAQFQPVTTALWSDPMRRAGVVPNKERGAGSLFGPDVAERFLKRHGFELLIRSHEQVFDGVAWPFGKSKHVLTVFSASNYSARCTNKGGYVLLSAPDAELVPGDDGFRLTQCGCRLSTIAYEAEQITTLQVERQQFEAIRARIFETRVELAEAYAEADVNKVGTLKQSLFASETARVTGVPINNKLLAVLVEGTSGPIDYAEFVKHFRLCMPSLEPLYPHREQMLHLMHYLDQEGSGSVRLRQFRTVCHTLRHVFGDRVPLCEK